MELIVKNLSTDKEDALQILDEVFANEYKADLVSQVCTAYQNHTRISTRGQKNRAAVRGGGKKPWKQKGSGRARAGTSSSPIWVGGGVTFAAQPNIQYRQKVNKKMYKVAMQSIVSRLFVEKRITVVDELKIELPKTKIIVALLDKLQLQDVLFVCSTVDDNLYLGARQLYHVGVCDVQQLDPISLIGYKHIVIEKDALLQLQDKLYLTRKKDEQ